jgi:hypothetical protein
MPGILVFCVSTLIQYRVTGFFCSFSADIAMDAERSMMDAVTAQHVRARGFMFFLPPVKI